MKQNLITLPENPHGLRIYNADPEIIQRRINKIQGRLDALDYVAKAEGRPFEDGEINEIEQLTTELDTLLAMLPGPGRAAASTTPGNGHHPATGGYAPGASADTWGFPTAGHFAVAVRDAARPGGGTIDPRLVQNAPSTISTEGTGADGGFAVPPQFKASIWQKCTGEDSLLPRCDENPTPSNTIIVPGDEGAPWDTSSGVRAYWEHEASQLTQSKVDLKQKTIRLNKLTALVPVSDELMEDAPGLDAYLRRKTGTIFDFKLNLGIVQGTGAGEPLGILNSASLVSVEKETGQTADTIVAENIMKMWSRMYGPCRRNAVWLINQDIEPQLFSMQFRVPNAAGTDWVGGTPVYQPASMASAPHATLMGRPVILSQACETLGDKGDVILVDLKQYMAAVKTGGIRTDVSMHLWFDYDVLAYRFILRVAGQPWWASAISARDGSNTYSWAVTLDERGE